MELGQKLQGLMNEQITEELYSSYIYLSMAAYFESISLPGFAHWMRAQSGEELEHAMKFFGHIHERGGRVILKAIGEPEADFAGPIDVMEKTLAHEQYISGLILKLYDIAVQEKEYASLSTLQWFVDEQVEEEETATEILDVLKRMGDKGHAIVMLDRQLAQRGG